jgi:hypothetical protein
MESTGPVQFFPDSSPRRVVTSSRESQSHSRTPLREDGNDVNPGWQLQRSPHQYQYEASPIQNNTNEHLPNRLDKLFGLHTDMFIEAHMDKYDRAMHRWKECSMDDWVAGADGASALRIADRSSSYGPPETLFLSSLLQNWQRSMARSSIS